MIKELKGLRLPISLGEKVIIYLPDGSKAQTFPKKINSVMYVNGYLQVNFSTINSQYSGYLKVREPSSEMFNGQIIRKGEMINTVDKDLESVEEIFNIRENGIYLKTQTGYFKGIISLQDVRPA